MGGNSQKSSSSSTPFDLVASEFAGLRPDLAELFQGVFDLFPQAFDFTSPATEGTLDNFRTPISEGELSLIEQIQQQAQNPSVNQQLSESLVGKTLSGDFLGADANPALADVIRFTTQNINDQFNEQDLAAKSLFARAGQQLPESSPFARAQAISNTGRLDAIGENTSNILFGAFENERGRQVQAIEQQRANAQFQLDQSLQGLQASALPRLIDDLGIERGLEEFTVRLQALTQALGIGASLAAPVPSQISTSKSKGGGGGLLTS